MAIRLSPGIFFRSSRRCSIKSFSNCWRSFLSIPVFYHRNSGSRNGSPEKDPRRIFSFGGSVLGCPCSDPAQPEGVSKRLRGGETHRAAAMRYTERYAHCRRAVISPAISRFGTPVLGTLALFCQKGLDFIKPILGQLTAEVVNGSELFGVVFHAADG